MRCSVAIRWLGLAAIVAVITWARPAQAATYVVSSSDLTPDVGDTVAVSVAIDSQNDSINSGQGTFRWPSAQLQLLEIQYTGSIFSYWSLKPAETAPGQIEFGGGAPNPGYIGVGGRVFQATFRAIAVGTAKLTVADGKILANDGLATDTFRPGDGLQVVIQEPTAVALPTDTNDAQRPTPTLRSTTHPQSAQWYQARAIECTWLTSNALGFSYSLTNSPISTPDDSVDTRNSSATLTAESDGIWYVHVKALYVSGWSGAAHLPVRIDSTAPAGFLLAIQQDRGLDDPTPEVRFFTHDTTSGVQRYTLAVDAQAPVETGSPYVLTGLIAGTHTVVVTAYDAAGNATTSRVNLDVVGHPAPIITSVSSPVLLFEHLTVQGTALPGDTITVYVDGAVSGSTTIPALSSSTNIILPWSIDVASPLRSGQHRVTATATSADGQTSAVTDPRTVRVIGQTMMWHGRPIATIALVTPAMVGGVALLIALIAVFTKLTWSIISLHRREALVEGELETLRQANRRRAVTPETLDITLGMIESDLQPSRRRRTARRR